MSRYAASGEWELVVIRETKHNNAKALLCIGVKPILVAKTQGQGPVSSLEALSAHVSIAHIAANAIWLFVSLILYNSYVEVDRQLGAGTLRRVFLSRPRQ